MNYFYIPIGLFVLSALYILFSLRIAWRRVGTQTGSSTSQSDRAYKAFEFFFTVTTAIVGGIGYVRISVMGTEPQLARDAMVLLAWLQYSATLFMIIAATSHLGSKWERWQQPNTKENIRTGWWRMVEPWMIILSFIIGTSVWFTAHTW